MATLLVQSSPSPPRSPTWGEARERLLSSDQVLPDFNLNKIIYPDVKGLVGEPLNIINALREPFSRLPEVWYLYDDKGSILFEEITKQPEYYVAHKEIEILTTHAESIALFPDEISSNQVRDFNSCIIELGAGSGKKMKPLLDATENMTQPILSSNFENDTLDPLLLSSTMSELVLTEEQFESFAEYRQNYHNFRKGKAKGSDGETKEALHQYAPAERSTSATTTTYIPVDYSAGALEENATVYNNFEHRAKNMKIECFVGTNDVALEELSKNEHAKERKTFIFLGNTIGNDLDPVPFLKSVMARCGDHDRLLLGVDVAANNSNKPKSIINSAYNDKNGITEQFILNSLMVVNTVVGSNLNFTETNWKMIAEYSEERLAMEIFTECVSKCDLSMNDADGKKVLIRSYLPGDRIFIEQSAKWNIDRIYEVSKQAGMVNTRSWTDEKGLYKVLELLPRMSRMRRDM